MRGIELDVLEQGERVRSSLDGTLSFIVESCPNCGVARRFIGVIVGLQMSAESWCSRCIERRKLEDRARRLDGLIRKRRRGGLIAVDEKGRDLIELRQRLGEALMRL